MKFYNDTKIKCLHWGSILDGGFWGGCAVSGRVEALDGCHPGGQGRAVGARRLLVQVEVWLSYNNSSSEKRKINIKIRYANASINR